MRFKTFLEKAKPFWWIELFQEMGVPEKLIRITESLFQILVKHGVSGTPMTICRLIGQDLGLGTIKDKQWIPYDSHEPPTDKQIHLAAEEIAMFMYDTPKENIEQIKKIILREFKKPSLFGEAVKKMEIDPVLKTAMNIPPEMRGVIKKLNAKYNSFYMNEWYIVDALATGLGIGTWKTDKNGKDSIQIQWDMNKAKNVDAAKVLNTAKRLVNEFSPKIQGELNKKDIAEIVDIINSELPKPSLFN